MTLEGLIAAARGERPAQLLLRNARLVNTFNGQVEEGDVAIWGGRIAGVGPGYQAEESIDLQGGYLASGLIDGHTHLESSHLHVPEYARAVVPRGTLAAVTDLHEIANVCGLEGVRYLLDCAKSLPLDLYLMVPSCVPATSLETSGAVLSAEDVQAALRWKEVLGLGEMMNFPGVLHREKEVLQKIALSRDRVIDGHSPGLQGKELNAYLAAGILSDHECTFLEEAREKLSRGMHIMIREGSSEKNLEALLPLVNDRTYRRCLFVVDDRSCADLLEDGDMDSILRLAARRGLDPIRAIQMASLNTAEYFGIRGLGGIAPGYWANLVHFDDLHDFRARQVFYRGRLVAKDGEACFSAPFRVPHEMTHTFHIKPFEMDALSLVARPGLFPVIEVVPGQILTRRRDEQPKVEGGFILSDLERDLLKLVVVERHKATGYIGLGLVKGFGLKKGALASSIAHDSHNIVAVSTNDTDLYLAIKEIERLQGGLVVAAEDKALAALPLPIAGLLSDQPLRAVAEKLEELERLAWDLGCSLPTPFDTLSYLALPVVPELRLTDLGLVDVKEFKLVT